MIVGVSLVNTVVKKLFSAWALSTVVSSTLLQKCILGMIYTKSRSEVLQPPPKWFSHDGGYNYVSCSRWLFLSLRVLTTVAERFAFQEVFGTSSMLCYSVDLLFISKRTSSEGQPFDFLCFRVNTLACCKRRSLNLVQVCSTHPLRKQQSQGIVLRMLLTSAALLKLQRCREGLGAACSLRLMLKYTPSGSLPGMLSTACTL